MKTILPAFKISGGKRYQFKHIISHFPTNYQNLHYIEPCAGAFSVLLNKPISIKETLNELDANIFNIIYHLKYQPNQVITELNSIKYSQNTFENAKIEMTEQEHIELAETLNKMVGKVVLSGYMSNLYKGLYKNWKLIQKDMPNHSGQTKTKQRRVECLWLNY